VEKYVVACVVNRPVDPNNPLYRETVLVPVKWDGESEIKLPDGALVGHIIKATESN
jgi:hypothetical protein